MGRGLRGLAGKIAWANSVVVDDLGFGRGKGWSWIYKSAGNWVPIYL